MSQPKKLTPMMEQYHKIKENYPDAILFYRLGDFYEMFHQDAIEASKVLEITLTSRNKNAENPVPMCGVPYHAANDYIRRLVEAGYKVAICEQMEDPKEVKGMVHREVVRVITPGTILQDEAVPNKENNFLATLHQHNGNFYIAYIDISTGELKLTQTSIFNQLIGEVQSIVPSEIIITPTFSEEQEKEIKERVISYYNDREYPLLGDSSLWSLDDSSLGEEETLNYLFSYLKSIQIASFQHVQAVERYELSQYLQMNHYAKAQLELFRSLRTQRRKDSLLALIDRTKTAMGGRLLHQWLDKPLIDLGKIAQRHQYVEQLMSFYFERIDLITRLEKVYDIERLVTKISMATATPRDIDQLRVSLQEVPQINFLLQSLNNLDENINHLDFQLLHEFKDLLEMIDEVLVESPPISATEGALIREGYSQELDQYRDALENGQNWLAELQQRERERTGLKTLKVGYNKVFGYYIEMSRIQSQDFDDPRYTRKQTLTNTERFITEELKEIETTIINAQEKSTSLEYHLFVDLRQKVGTYVQALQELANQLAKLDVLCNFASLSESEDYHRANLVTGNKEMTLIDSRHPVVENLIGKSQFVPNDVYADDEHYFLLLTGPNMSGKSTYMRQIAYAVILNQIGCFVPAKEAKMPIFDKIFTRIGSADDISIGQSTFMVEMMETQVALEEATEQSLILFDEIGRGTATYDGMALADGIIKYIAGEIKALTIFSTHYHELTELESQIPGVKNIHVGAKEHNGDLIFLHKVLEGPADKSYGIHVAKLAGLPNSVIQESMTVLADLEDKAQRLFNQNPEIEQVSLFEVADNPQNELLEELKSIDINNMTPLQAFEVLKNLLDELK